MKYLKVWTNFRQIIKTLEYDEIGRLFEAMLAYAENGQEPEEFTGNEIFLWPVAKQMIDLAAEKAETLRQNGMRGGRPKNQEEPDETKQNQTKPNKTKPNQPGALVSDENQTKAYKEKKRNEKEGNEKESNDRGITDDEAAAIANDHDRIFSAAEDAGFPRTNAVRARLIDIYAQHGLEKVLSGIESCVRHGATNLAYLEACMTDRPKPGEEPDPFNRSYKNAQQEAIDRLMAMGGWGDEDDDQQKAGAS